MGLKNPPFGQPYTFDFLNVKIYHISYFKFNWLYFRHDI